MHSKFNYIKRILFPNKKVLIIVVSIFILGVISGSIFSNIININDKNLVIDKIQVFINNINNLNIKDISVLKNSLSTNLIYDIVIFILGFTIIGILCNIFLLYIKGFILGFTLSSFIITYSYKGIILSFLYLIFGQVLNILVIFVLTTYSILFTYKLLNLIFKNKINIKLNKFIKHYFIILIMMILISIISSLCESYVLSFLIKIMIKLFI